MSKYARVFTKEKLNKMFSLRRKGWNYKALAELYGVDHGDIYQQCKKYHVKKGKKEAGVTISEIVSFVLPYSFIFNIVEISINKRPLSYSDYLKLSNE